MLRRVSQGLFLIGAIALLYFAPRHLFSLVASDPLSAWSAVLSSKTFFWSWGWGLLILSLLIGRFFCGWICPIGTLNHILGSFKRKSLPSGNGRFFKYALLFVLLLTAAVGVNLTGWMDPLSLFVRVGNLREIGILAWAPILLILGLNVVRPRFWCRYVCPLGAMLGIFSWLGFNRFQAEKCVKCGLCSSKCQQGVAPHRAEGECINCGNCQTVCPRKEQVFAYSRPTLNKERRWILGGMLGTLPLFFLKFKPKSKPSTLLRPPGIRDEQDFLARCARCGLCTQVCPSKALHPVVFEGGIESIFTPQLVPQLGYCEDNCHLCGQKCPTGAIPSLSLAQKNQAKIGVARVIPDRCYGCMRCVRACPQGALKEGAVPVVDPAKCRGCGKCEHVCPAQPVAIKVVAL